MGRTCNAIPNSTKHRQVLHSTSKGFTQGAVMPKSQVQSSSNPDTEATFQIVLNPEILPDDETSATATLFTDSPKTPIVHLTIVATAKRFATLTPNVCEFRKVHPETIHQKTVKLTVNAPLNTSDIRLLPSGHEVLTWEMTPNPGTDTSLITIRLGPLKDKGTFSSLLTVYFPNQRTLTLPVIAKVVHTD